MWWAGWPDTPNILKTPHVDGLELGLIYDVLSGSDLVRTFKTLNA